MTVIERETRSMLTLALRLASERGQTMAEYGILIAVIALIVIIAAVSLGTNISDIFRTTATKV